MNSDNKFWISVWTLVVFFVLGMSLIFSNHYGNNNRMIIEAAMKGANPIELTCAIDGLGGTEARAVACNEIVRNKFKTN